MSDAAILQSGNGNVAINTQVVDIYNTKALIDQYDIGQENQASIVQFGSSNGAVNAQDSSTNSFVGIVQGGNRNAGANTYVGGTDHVGLIAQFETITAQRTLAVMEPVTQQISCRAAIAMWH